MAKSRAAAFPIGGAAAPAGNSGVQQQRRAGVGIEPAPEIKAAAETVAAAPVAISTRGLGWEVGQHPHDGRYLANSTYHRPPRCAGYLRGASDIYDPILRKPAVNERSPLDASIILLAACQDYQNSRRRQSERRLHRHAQRSLGR